MAFDEEIKGQQEATDSLAQSQENVANTANLASQAQEGLNAAWERGRQVLENHGETLEKIKNFFTGDGALGPEKFKEALADISNFTPDAVISGFEKFREVAFDSSGQVSELGVTIGSTLLATTNALPGAQNAFAEMGNSATTAGSQMQDSFKGIAPILEHMGVAGEFVQDRLTPIFNVADRARNLELNIMRNAAAAGDLKAIYDETVPTIQELRDETTSFTEMTYQVAQATGTAHETVSQYAAQLQQIPGTLREQVDVFGDASVEMNMLEATMKVASGTHQEFSDVVGQLNEAYRNFNTTGDESLELISRMGVVAQELQMPMDIVRSTTLEAAKGFKFFGDNTQGVINILGRMGSALDETIGPAAVGELTQQISQGIQNLDIAHKAFFSTMTGGPGGLAGGMEIDLMLQEGNIDEVFGKIQETMQGQFGEALTLREARDTGQENRLFQQVEFLKQMGVAGGDSQAYRLLEAMQEGRSEDFEDAISTPQEALKQSVEQGTEIQERQYTVLTDINNQVSRIQQLTAIGTLAGVRRTVGMGGNQELVEYLQNRVQQASDTAATKGAAGAGPDFNTTLQEGVSGAFTDLKEGGKKAWNELGQTAADTMVGIKNFAVGEEKKTEATTVEPPREGVRKEGETVGLTEAMAKYSPEGGTPEGEKRRVTSLLGALEQTVNTQRREDQTTAAGLRGEVRQALPQGRTVPANNDVPVLLRQMAEKDNQLNELRNQLNQEGEEPAVVHLIIEERGKNGQVTVKEANVKRTDTMKMNFTGFSEE